MAQYIKLQSTYKDMKLMLFFGIALVPIGIGIVILFLLYRSVTKNYWEIHPSTINVFSSDSRNIIEIQNIVSVQLKQTKRQKKHLIGDISIVTNSRTWDEFILTSICNAPLYAESIQLAIDTIKAKRKHSISVRPEEHTDLAIGGLDRMNDLVGLWQAGMISDEDFYSEKEKFERGSSS